ncbi:hypothetical protein [Asticcacaulis excentricus]|uniref:hypothetical protein n=1 Tax=Asticcacaulis excentricus TaxID=78587 RepID=UPI000F83D9C0|nr:hypothetical protein [Asticcacaulis excentricus]
MTETTDMAGSLTPEQRREHLRAYADRMLLALSAMDAPETPDAVTKGIRTALMIERLYARCDASQAQAHKHAIAAIEDQVKLKNKLEWSGNWLDKAPDVPFITLKPEALKGMQWPCPPRDYVGELKARIDQIKAASQPKPQPQPAPAPVAPVAVTPQPKPKSEPAAPSRPLTPQEMALRERVLNTVAIPRPQDTPLTEHDYGLIRDEDVEILHGDRLPRLYEMGETRDTLLKALKAYSREDLNLLWPDLFPLDTG